MSRPFKVLGVQQIAIGGPDKTRLQKLWIDMFGLEITGTFKSERENVDEDICAMGTGPFKVEVDLMQPLDPEKKPAVHTTPLNHVGLWIDRLPEAVEWLTANGVRFAPGGIRKGAAGFFSGSSGCIKSTSTLNGPVPMAQMSSSTFSRSLLNVLVISRPNISTQSFCRRVLSGPPMAICWMPKTLKGRVIYSNSTIIWSTVSDSPLEAATFLTTPSCAANSTFSIFMASITATRSPACTFWPGCTDTSTKRPGMGEIT